jgi:hypothetical protein
VTFRIFHSSDQEGGWWSSCHPGGPAAIYRWSVDGKMLTLRPVGKDPCRERAVVWAGTWTRTG